MRPWPTNSCVEEAGAAVRISLVTVCRNAASTIRRTLESADAQRGVELEHIVVDGASDDGTVAELEALMHE